jgi:hypothetical protein
MATPVVISRMQNRRGTKSEFLALYPSYPGTGSNILQPGELALCTDTAQVFIGNINGEYFEIGTGGGGGGGSLTNLELMPLVISLSPVVIPTVIPALSHLSTPFLSLLYSVVNVITSDPNTVGTTFSRNGKLSITATATFVPVPPVFPFPPILPVSLTDDGTEINTTAFDINFTANYDISGTLIEISYTHNFPGNLTFSTSSIIWAPI